MNEDKSAGKPEASSGDSGSAAGTSGSGAQTDREPPEHQNPSYGRESDKPDNTAGQPLLD